MGYGHGRSASFSGLQRGQCAENCRMPEALGNATCLEWINAFGNLHMHLLMMQAIYILSTLDKLHITMTRCIE